MGEKNQALDEEGLWQSTAMVLWKKSKDLRLIQEFWNVAALSCSSNCF